MIPVKQRKMWSLLPQVLSFGFMGSFVTADFTSKVVKPSLGMENLGFVSTHAIRRGL